MDKHEREVGIDAILQEILKDPEVAFRSVSVLYQDFQVRMRIARLSAAMDLPSFRQRLAVARAGVGLKEGATPDWEHAIELSHSLPDDMQGVFLVLAKATMVGGRCRDRADLRNALHRACPPSDHLYGRARYHRR